MMNLTIDRTKWLVGERSSVSGLLREDGKMCCLGFYCKALGFTDAELLYKRNPGEFEIFPVKLHPDIIYDLVQANDSSLGSEDWSISRREEEITKLFKKMDVEVEFIN